VAGVLAGYRVLDLADEKGMLAAKILAGMGAGVTRLDKAGAAYPLSPSEDAYLNAGKSVIGLDLEKDDGRKLFRRLATKADVIIETAPPGYLASLGLGYAELSETNPSLVMASITGFGQDGPYCDYQSCDLVAAALGGWLSVCGEPEAPLKPFGHQAYDTASLFTANGILLALWHRHTTGWGQHLDISLMECVAATLDHVLVRYFNEGVVARRQGSLHWNSAFRVFPCRDGYILLSLFQHWETLVEWLESEGMAADLADERWRDRETRLEGLDHIIEVLEKWTLSHTVAELVEKGQLMHFPWAEVASVNSLLRSPQLVARGYFKEIEIAGRKYKVPGAPWRTSR
jgi:crotonobetainyl-CoA:carnitine CoA-transferase CaiB-like acyl-CoA transferase